MSGFFGRMSSRTPASTTTASDATRPPAVSRSQSTDSRSSDDGAADGAKARASALRRHQRQLRSANATTKATGGGREKRRPVVVRYELSSASAAAAAESDDGGVLSSDDAAVFAPFDVESAMAGFAASFSPKKRDTRAQRPPTASAPATRARSQTRSRLAMSLSRTQRAELKAQKYDVEWRADQDCACCQVCYAMFTKLSRRRHHCRVCGDLVCGDCSGDQVLLAGRFDAPKRACVACVTLLQTMLHNGDARVSVEGGGSSKQQLTTTAHPPPLATPKYHDRLGEVHRVMAAGKKSERRGSTQSEMYVISSSWLRRWLAFTRSSSDDHPYSSHADSSTTTTTTMSDVFASSSTSTVFSSPSNSLIHATAAPPGPIDNLALLELSKGKLVKRPELLRDDCADSSSADDASGYQFISTEVWEVLQRLYGGGPGIRVASDDGFSHWHVDVSALLTAAAGKVTVSPTVERVLVTRHEASAAASATLRASYISVEKAALISSGGYESTAVLSQSAVKPPSTPNPLSASSSSVNSLDKSSSGGAADRGSVGSRGSFNHARVRPNSPQFAKSHNGVSSSKPGAADLAATAPVRASTKYPADAFDDLRDSKAATAASAFALAMKQARLNAQKALEDRARGTQHAEAA